jgi:integrase
VREFARFLGRSPDTATVEDLRRYQLHLVDHGTSPVSLNHAITGLKFFFEVTLDRPELMVRMHPVRVPRTLPVVLSPDEVRRLIEAAGNLKHQTALSVAYGAGLRASEVVALKVGDIDSQRMTLRIEQGKGRRDRYAMLSPVLLERLRVWWHVARTQGKMLDGGWLFPAHDLFDTVSKTGSKMRSSPQRADPLREKRKMPPRRAAMEKAVWTTTGDAQASGPQPPAHAPHR